MQQRVGLARAFATDADILLMDEPFSALDPLIRTRLQDELLLLQERLKKTILFVSHDLDEAAKLGNRIVIMEGGRIVQAGTVADIVLRPADRYVSDFVRHMNPLDALRAETFMVTVEDLGRDGDAVVFGAAPGIRLTLGPDGRPVRAEMAGRPIAILAAEVAGDGAATEMLVLVPASLPLKAAVGFRQRGVAGLVVVDPNGIVLGAACEDDLFRALLRH